MKIIAIAGGSGAGKSTLTYKLIDSDPETFEVIHLDDYQKWKTDPDLPMVGEMANFDHPDVIQWQKLIEDIKSLSKGRNVEVLTWGQRPDVDYSARTQRVNREIIPKKILIVDGYLSLWNPELRSLYDRKYFLDLAEDKRLNRRNKFIYPEYRDQVLIPMHNKYIEPTKEYADLIINSENLDAKQIYLNVIEDLKIENLY